MEVIRNDNNEVIERRIYISDNSSSTYCLKNQYPSCLENQYPIDSNIKENIIDLKIDRLYYCVINNQMDSYEEFNHFQKEEFKNAIKQLEFNYTKEIMKYFSEENKAKIKTILYFLADTIKQKKRIPYNSTTRASLIFIYDKCKKKEAEYINTSDQIISFYDYYYKSVMLDMY